MRWPAIIVLIYLTIALQMGLAGFIDRNAAAPNLVLPVVVFIAVNARREESLLLAFALGALLDLFTQHPLGLYAFCYGLVGLFIVGAQSALYRDHPLTHFSVTLSSGLLTGLIVLFCDWAGTRVHGQSPAPASMFGPVVTSAFYTALLAPFMLYPLVRIKKIFGFGSRRPFAGLPYQPGHIERQ